MPGSLHARGSTAPVKAPFSRQRVSVSRSHLFECALGGGGGHSLAVGRSEGGHAAAGAESPVWKCFIMPLTS